MGKVIAKARNQGRWTKAEDDFLRRHFEAVGDLVGTHDLGRAPGAAARRVSELKRRGLWSPHKAQP